MLTQEEEIYLAVLIAVSFLSLVLIFFIINLIVNQRKIRRLQKTLISAEIMTLENERRRFSQDLHDEVGPNLSAALLYVNMLEPLDEESGEMKIKVEEIINLTLEQIRTISRNIIPKYIQEQGLKASIEGFVGNLNQALGQNVTIRLDIVSIPNLSEMANLNVYRIVQESINNAIKHSKAKEIRVHISVNGSSANVVISDNGRGFEYTGMQGNQSAGGIGLKNIQNRVISLGGQLNIYSQIGKGTQIVAEIPVLHESNT